MELPLYDKSDLYQEKMDGEYLLGEFEECLEELVDSLSLEGAALGIAKKVLNEGSRNLSPAQISALNAGLFPFKKVHCARCENLMVVTKKEEEPVFCSCMEDLPD